MTIKELKQYRSICSEILEVEAEIKDSTVHGVVRGSDDSFPYLSHSILVSGVMPTRDNVKTFNRLRNLKRRKCTIEDFIQSIDDSLTRRIFKMHFIKGFSWGKVAVETNNSEASVKMICYRYIKNQKK